MLAIIPFIFCSCLTTHDVAVLAKVDPGNKTITMQTGSDPYLMGLKKTLIEEGWKIEVFKGATVTTTVDNKEIESDSYNTNYVLETRYNYAKDIVLGHVLHSYRISIIDVESRSEILLMNGTKARLNTFLSNFKSSIKELSS